TGLFSRTAEHAFHRHRFIGIPVIIEAAHYLPGDPAHAENIDILKVHGAEREILITDIAAAGNEHLAIHHHQLVVHAVVDAPELADLAEVLQQLAPQGDRVEELHLDAWVVIE